MLRPSWRIALLWIGTWLPLWRIALLRGLALLGIALLLWIALALLRGISTLLWRRLLKLLWRRLLKLLWRRLLKALIWRWPPLEGRLFLRTQKCSTNFVSTPP